MSAMPQSLRDAIVDFLRRHPPFDSVEAKSLVEFAAQAQAGYYAEGTLVIGRESGAATTLFVVQRGLVRARSPEGSPGQDEGLLFGAGEAFPLAAVMAGRATTLDYVAGADTFTYEFPREAVEALANGSRPFQRFCARQVDMLLQQATERLRAAFANSVLADQSSARSLESIIRRDAVVCPVGTPLRDALGLMASHRIGSIVVVDADRRPVGIFTERDLVRITAAGAFAPEEAIEGLATRTLVTLPASATAADAALAMAEHGIRHLLVLNESKLAGVVSERDLFGLQRLTMGQVASRIAAADHRDDLVAAAAEIRKLAESLLAQGVGAENLTRLISALNDRLTRRILDLEWRRHGLHGTRCCWLALGSEGRHEQTISTDQDNAFIFAAAEGEAPDAARARLLPFARTVNEALDACGFPLCKGNVMASNPDLCLSVGEWEARFERWMRHPEPEALLNASILFDFRGLWGESSLAEGLRARLASEAPTHRLFLRTLAEDALRARVPIDWLGRLVTSGEDTERETIDLKLQGTRLFIDAARVNALEQGVRATNTAERLRAAGEGMGIRREDIEATVDAFHFVLMLRLRQQRLHAAGGSPNRVRPAELNELDRRILKEALRRAHLLQQRLALDHRL